MKINYKIFSIPPYISTSWKNISSLHVEEERGLPILVVILNTEQRIEIPGLEPAVIEGIFQMHTKFLELETQKEGSLEQISFSFPMKIPMTGMEGMGTLLQHNPQQADSPPLPPDILEKITHLSKTVGIDNSSITDAEPHCNCMHCQIVRALHNTQQAEESEEEVSEKDLQFRDWEIQKNADKLFTVINPLEPQEKYQVFVGSPVGCTCGRSSCEHLLAVLRS